MANKIFRHDTIAIIYDFDGTLSPQPMQEYTVLPQIGIKPKQFWAEVKREAIQTESEEMLVYMRLLLEKAEDRRVNIGRREFKSLAKKIRYFQGVQEWFPAINNYIVQRGRGRIKVRHYIISAGIKEILDGISIKKWFARIYASEYHYDHHDVAKFLKLLITDTSKTQFLFRINKGKEELTESINEHTPESSRTIPFQNMIYIGDGMTDVPSMTVTKKSGGHTIAVHDPHRYKARAVCKKLLDAGRVDFVAPADYRAGSVLTRRVNLLLDAIIADIEYRREAFACKRALGLQ